MPDQETPYIPETSSQSAQCFDSAMQEYFDTLPKFVQESIKMTSVTFDSLEDMRNCAEGILEDRPEG